MLLVVAFTGDYLSFFAEIVWTGISHMSAGKAVTNAKTEATPKNSKNIAISCHPSKKRKCTPNNMREGLSKRLGRLMLTSFYTLMIAPHVLGTI